MAAVLGFFRGLTQKSEEEERKKPGLVAYTFNRSDLGGLEGFLRIQLVSNNNNSNNNNNRVEHGDSHCNPSTWESRPASVACLSPPWAA